MADDVGEEDENFQNEKFDVIAKAMKALNRHLATLSVMIGRLESWKLFRFLVYKIRNRCQLNADWSNAKEVSISSPLIG